MFVTVVPSTPSGCMHLNATMDFLAAYLITTFELKLMHRFSRDNGTLDLISQAGSVDLLEVVLGHAKQFYSVVECEVMMRIAFTFSPRYC